MKLPYQPNANAKSDATTQENYQLCVFKEIGDFFKFIRFLMVVNLEQNKFFGQNPEFVL